MKKGRLRETNGLGQAAAFAADTLRCLFILELLSKKYTYIGGKDLVAVSHPLMP